MTFANNSGNNTVFGGTGAMTVQGGTGNGTFNAFNSVNAPLIGGAAGNNVLVGGVGGATLVGGGDGDHLFAAGAAS